MADTKKQNAKSDQLQNLDLNQQATDLGLDQNEQVMNGLYGMSETKKEDELNG